LVNFHLLVHSEAMQELKTKEKNKLWEFVKRKWQHN
jgi:hypothetical protein